MEKIIIKMDSKGNEVKVRVEARPIIDRQEYEMSSIKKYALMINGFGLRTVSADTEEDLIRFAETEGDALIIPWLRMKERRANDPFSFHGLMHFMFGDDRTRAARYKVDVEKRYGVRIFG